jgi:murein DD-endopeptidase MepM/ murein hydrolase activator NlpD
MPRTFIVSAAVVGLAVTGLTVPVAATATAAEGTGKRVCPAEDFWVGAGWGADRGRRSHMGIDLGGKRGSRLFAIEDGVIDRTKRQSNGALQIVMRGESGSKFYYGHMDDVLVKGGQKVKAGEVIGTMGDSGSPGAVHLHFEYWRSGGESAAVDPAPLVTRVCGLGKDGPSDDEPAETSEPEPVAVTETATVAPKLDPAIKGDVFSNE